MMDNFPFEEDGFITSLERRQRKSADRADTHRFFGIVTVGFLALTALFLCFELGTFLVHPESALTGRFVIEIYRSIYGVLHLPVLFFYEMQDVAWTLNAIVYGADFELRGLQVTRGIATVLLWTNVILAGAMIGFLLMYAALCAQSSSACLGPRRLGVRVGAICAPTLAYYCFALLTTRNFWRPGPQTATCLGLWTATASLFVGWRSVASLRPDAHPASCSGSDSIHRHGSVSSRALGWGLFLWTWVQVRVRGKARQRPSSSSGTLPSSASLRRRAGLGTGNSASHVKQTRGGQHAHVHPTSSVSSSSNGGNGSSSGLDGSSGSMKSRQEASSAMSHAEPASTPLKTTSSSGAIPTGKHGSSSVSSTHIEPNPGGYKPPPTEHMNSKPSAQSGGTKKNTSSKAAQKLERSSGTSSSSASLSSIGNPASIRPNPTPAEKATQATLATQSQAALKREHHAANASAKHAAGVTTPPPPPPPPPSQSSSRAAATGRQLESLVMRNTANQSLSSDSGTFSKTNNSTAAINRTPQHPLTTIQQQQQRASPAPTNSTSSSSLGALFGGLTGRSNAAATANHPASSHPSVHPPAGNYASSGNSSLSGKPNATSGVSHAHPASAAMQQQRATSGHGVGTAQNSTRAVQYGANAVGKPASYPLQPPPPSSSIVRPSIGSFAAAAAAGVAVFRAAVTPSLLLSASAISPGKQSATAPTPPSILTMQSPLKTAPKAGKGTSSSKTPQQQTFDPSTPTKQQQYAVPPPPPPPPPHQQYPTHTSSSNGSASPSPKPLNPSAPAFRYNPFVSPPSAMSHPSIASAVASGASYSPPFDDQQRAYQQQDYDSYNLLHKQEQDLWQTVTSSAASRHTASSATPLEQHQHQLPFSLDEQQQGQIDGLSFFTSGSMFSEHLIAHKHASGDLDLSSAAANYSPFTASEQQQSYTHLPDTIQPAAAPTRPAVLPVLQQHKNMHGRARGSDSEFSFFSTPPPCTSAHLPAPSSALTHPSYGGLSLGMGFAEQLQQRTLEQQQHNQQRQQGGLFDASRSVAVGGPSADPWFYGASEEPMSALSYDSHVFPIATSAQQQVAYTQDSAAHSAGNTLVARLVMAATTRQYPPTSVAVARGAANQQQQQQQQQGWGTPASFLSSSRLGDPTSHNYAYGQHNTNTAPGTTSYNAAYQGAQAMPMAVILPTGLPGSPLQECLSEFGFVESDSLPPPGPMGPLKSVLSSAAAASAGADEDDGNTCVVCWVNPRQVGFLHGNTSHLCVCRSCASTMREGDRCVVCRATIERIIIIY